VLVEQFGDEYLEEQDEVEFLTSEEEPRTLAEIIEAEREFFDKVWYVRSVVHDDDDRELADDMRTGMMAARERIEAQYGNDELWKAIGPGHDEAWQYGYISGKLVPHQATFARSMIAAELFVVGVVACERPAPCLLPRLSGDWGALGRTVRPTSRCPAGGRPHATDPPSV
jgi:hypothetical protein